MRRLTLKRQPRGFSMVEILVTITIIGIIAIFVIPNFLDSLHKAKQKRTMADLHAIGRAAMSWLTGEMGAAAAGAAANLGDYGSAVDSSDLRDLLVPDYVADVPRFDGWGNDFEYFLKTDDLLASQVMLIRSPGRDGVFSTDSYSFGPFVATDYAQDIVWADGIFIRWPSGVSTSDP